MIDYIVQFTGLLSIYLFIGWLISWKRDKYAWVDFFWSSSFLIVVVSLFPSWSRLPQLLISILFIAWSLRLSSLLFFRIWSKSEDPRYIKLKASWGKNYPFKFLILYLFEALLAAALCLPLYIYALEQDQSLNYWNYAGLLIFAIALIGELISDKQLAQFKKDNIGKNNVCDLGLWKYSRHPNYFFEVTIWFSYGIYCMSTQWWFLGFIPFVIMYIFITKITGVPYAEEQSIKRLGEKYLNYQKKTSVLVPWKVKEN